GGVVLGLNLAVCAPRSRISVGRWRRVKQAEAEWEPRFAEVFAAKEGTPRIVDRSVARCGAIVDVVDAPPKLMAAGLQDRAELLSAAYGDPSTRIDEIGRAHV